MSIHQSIEFFVVINLFVIGLSHLLRPQIWIAFFQFLHTKGNVGNICNALIALGMGSIIFSFHFLWEWPMILVTLYGLAQIAKGLIYLIFPSVGIKSIGKVNSTKFKWVGLVMALLSIALFIQLLSDGAFS